MELDDLKQSWKQSTDNLKPLNKNIMYTITNKQYGPLAELKRKFRKPMILVPFIALFGIFNAQRMKAPMGETISWLLIALSITAFGYFFYSYNIIKNLENITTNVKENFEKQVIKLETSFKVRLIVIRSIFVAFIIALELQMQFSEVVLTKWATVSIGIRLLVYAAFLALIFIMTHLIVKYKYKKQIGYLKQLVEQMQ